MKVLLALLKGVNTRFCGCFTMMPSPRWVLLSRGNISERHCTQIILNTTKQRWCGKIVLKIIFFLPSFQLHNFSFQRLKEKPFFSSTENYIAAIKGHAVLPCLMENDFVSTDETHYLKDNEWMGWGESDAADRCN